MKNYLKIEELKDLWLYKINARNGYVGIWVKEANGFLLPRLKFGHWFVFMEYHYDLGAFAHGTVKPIEEIEKCPFTGDDLKLKRITLENGNKYWDYDDNTLKYLMERQEELKPE
jgi:hypothetical protein